MGMEIDERATIFLQIEQQLEKYRLSFSVEHTSNPWASLTFVGRTYRISLCMYGADAAEAIQSMHDEIPDMEFELSGAFVADAVTALVKEDPEKETVRAGLIIDLLVIDE